jgi:beta-N-acetylhexosaminidase
MAQQLEDLIGSKLVIGVPGTRITTDIVNHFRQIHAGGIIFYRINFEAPDQLRKLISDLENALGRKLLVCVDHEGGRVVMYRDGVTVFPDNLAFGHAGKVEYARQAGEIAGKELRALGTDINFAPTLDVLTQAYSPNIGIRSFGEDWKTVADMGVAYIQGLQGSGVSATAKHFPGLGHAQVDPHLKMPVMHSTWDEMRGLHLPPFIKAIEAGVDVMMSSHPKFPKLDPAPGNIATFSRVLMTDCLRNELGFKGVLASDDLEMGAVKEAGSMELAAVKTVAAGHDLVLSCHDLNAQNQIFRALLEAYKTKALPVNELEASVDRIEKLKAKRSQRFFGKFGPVPEGAALAMKVAEEAVTVFQDHDKILPLSTRLKQDIGIVFPQLSALAKKIMIEKPFEDEVGFFHHTLGHLPEKHVTEVYGIDPSEEDIENCANLASRSTVTLFFCFDAHLHPAEQKLFAMLQRSARKLVVILMRDPYDKTFLRGKDVGLTAFGFRACQIKAVIGRIYGEGN